MTATTKRPWELLDHTKSMNNMRVTMPAGTHQLERIPNPKGYPGNWLVIKGTTIGMSEGAWRDWKNGDLNSKGKPIDWGEFEIAIQE